MDEVTRAVELTKARMLELNGAFLQVLCHTKDRPKTYVELRAYVEKLGLEWTRECGEIRSRVERDQNTAAEEAPPELSAYFWKEIRDIKVMLKDRLRATLENLLDPDGIEAAVASMDDHFDKVTGPLMGDLLRITAQFEEKIKEMNGKLEELKADDEGEDWKR